MVIELKEQTASAGVDVIYTEAQALHRPGLLGARGGWRQSRDDGVRMERMLAAVQDSGHRIYTPASHGLAPVRRVHTDRYLSFLEGAFAAWSQLAGASEQMHANVFAMRRHGGGYPTSIEGQAAFHFHDQLAPIGADTWEVASTAANLAVDAAERVMRGRRCSYAMCRPPGHHAYADMAGGGTYLNNAAIAAEHLLQRWPKVAIIDVDVHHGNGTQDIFWNRADVFFGSLHRDPSDYHPFFCGYADEIGEGAGIGCNLNVPLRADTGDEAYLAKLDQVLEKVSGFAPGALVVSLGLDGHCADPAAGLQLTNEAYAGIGARIESLKLPTVLVQEGGYNTSVVGSTLSAVLDAWRRPA